MPDLNENVLLNMTPNQRWAARMNQAWSEVYEPGMQFYTDYAPKVETPDPERLGRVKREVLHGYGRIQIWAKGRPTAKQDSLSEVYDGVEWYGFAELVEKSKDYKAIKAAVVALLKKVKSVELVEG